MLTILVTSSVCWFISFCTTEQVAQSDARQTGDQEFAGSIPTGSGVWQHSVVEIGHEIFSTVILFFPPFVSFW